MFAHKSGALLDRNAVTNRDIFDCWFFIHKHTPVNKAITERRMNTPLADYLQKCIEQLESMNDKGLLNDLEELMDNDMKKFGQTNLRTETIALLKFYKDFPVFE
jgi:hypothetical protein